MQKILAILSLIVAALALLLVNFYGKSSKDLRPPKPEGHLAKLIPLEIGKWHGKDVPLGETEEVIRASESLLAVSEFLCRKYFDSEGQEFSLYISYWAQGKEPTVKAASHIPDNCWVRNGWDNIASAKNYGEELVIEGKTFMPLYSRKFGIKSPDGSVNFRNVWFWFIIEGESYNFGVGDTAIPSPINYIKNMIREANEGIPEQYFIRLDSNLEMKELYNDEDFKKLLKLLGELAIYKNTDSDKNANSNKEAK